MKGLVHNDDPNAAELWMPPGSFWTQPKGDVHITAAKGDENVAYIEIEEGPYLVRPVEDAFSSDEKPINLIPASIDWIPYSREQEVGEGVMVAPLWVAAEDH